MNTRRSRERGVTLVELLIAVSLVAAISTGLLLSMRTSLTALERTQGRLEENRRTMGVQQLILRQIGGVMPVMEDCGGPGRRAAFRGTEETLRFVSGHSLAQGSRGYPQVVEYLVAPESGGGFRLLLRERLFYGSGAAGPACAANPAPIVLAERLAYCRFFYREFIPESLDQGNWVPAWDRPNLPASVRLEMAPAAPNPARLPMVSLHVPIHITRDVLGIYVDQ